MKRVVAGGRPFWPTAIALAIVSLLLVAGALSAPPAAQAQSGDIYLEAEAGAVAAPMAILDDAAASACAYVSSASGENGTTTLSFSLPAARTVYLWGRTRGVHSGANSFYVKIDAGAEVRWDFPVSTDWAWSAMKDSSLGRIISANLAAGAHTIRIRTREANSALDVAALTSSATVAPTYVASCGPTATPTDTTVPTDTATPAPTRTFTPTQTPGGATATATATLPPATATRTPTTAQSGNLYLEAETGALAAPMAILDDPAASACGYVVSASGENGTTTLNFSLPAARTVYLWGRTLGVHSGANSFYVKIDAGAEVRWDFPVSTDWVWSAMKDSTLGRIISANLAAGAHTIRIRTREANSAIDVVALTSSATVAPTYVASCGPTATPTDTAMPAPTRTFTPTQTPGGATATATATLPPATATRTPTVTATSSGVTATPTPYGVMRLEPEDSAELRAPFVIGTDSTASRCRYVYSDLGTANGSLGMYFNAPMAGVYQMWVRLQTPTYANAFLVAFDDSTGASAFHWNPVVTTSWTWVKVTNADAGSTPWSAFMSEGVHYIFLAALRGGAKIDAIEFVYQEATPGRTYTPSWVQPCGPATSTPTPTPTYTRTPVPNPPYTNTLVLQRGLLGYAGVIDSMIDFRNPSTNFGRSTMLYLRGNNASNALLRYQLTGLPANAQIISATLGIYMIPRADVENRHQMTTTVYSLIRPFSELQVNWFQAATGNRWGVPGVNDPASDFHLWPSYEVEHYFWMQRADQKPQWFTYTVTSMVQSWVDDPASNAGFIIKATYPHETWQYFCSSEYWAAEFRPRLQIIYYPRP